MPPEERDGEERERKRRRAERRDEEITKLRNKCLIRRVLCLRARSNISHPTCTNWCTYYMYICTCMYAATQNTCGQARLHTLSIHTQPWSLLMCSQLNKTQSTVLQGGMDTCSDNKENYTPVHMECHIRFTKQMVYLLPAIGLFYGNCLRI